MRTQTIGKKAMFLVAAMVSLGAMLLFLQGIEVAASGDSSPETSGAIAFFNGNPNWDTGHRGYVADGQCEVTLAPGMTAPICMSALRRARQRTCWWKLPPSRR